MTSYAKVAAITIAMLLSCVVLISTDTDAVEGEAISDATGLANAFAKGGTFYLEYDIEVQDNPESTVDSEPIFTVSQNVTVNLDLNGHHITASLDTNNQTFASCQLIRNNGTLNITNTGDTENGYIANIGTNSHASTRTIQNSEGATLNISSGTVYSLKTTAIINLGECTISGTATIAAYLEGYSGGWNNACVGIDNNGNGVLHVNGGTITAASQSGIYVYTSTAVTEITDGTIIGGNLYGAISGSYSQNVSIQGGSFSSNVSSMLDSGYYVTLADGMYVVQNVTDSGTIHVSTETGLLDALPDDSATEVSIVLGDNIELTQDITVPTNTTIVIPAGCVLTVSDVVVVTLNGTIDNSGEVDIEGFVSNPVNIIGEGTFGGIHYDTDGYYEISTAMDLQWLAYLMNEKPHQIWEVVQLNTVTMPSDVEFQMLGTSTGTSPIIFEGTFDGDSYSISGIKMIDRTSNTGFFFGLQNATVSNLTLNVEISTDSAYDGGLAYCSYGGVTVENVTISGSVTVTGSSYGTGGFFGTINPSGSTTFVSCTNNANVGGAGTYNVGGLFGTCEGLAGEVGMYNCSNNGTVTSKGAKGFAFGWGYVGTGTTITIIGFNNSVEGLTYCSSPGTTTNFNLTYMSSEYVAMKNSEGNWVAGNKGDVVATIDSANYSSLEAAIDAAEAHDTIVLQKDINALGHTVIDKGVNLNLNGHTITLQLDEDYSIGIEFTSGASTILGNGKIDDPRGLNSSGFYTLSVSGNGTSLTITDTVIEFEDGQNDFNYGMQAAIHSSVTLGDGATIQSVGRSDGMGVSCGVIITGDGNQVNTTVTMLDGSLIDVNMIGIGGNGNQDPSQGATTIDMQGGKIDAGIGTGIFQSQIGEVRISGNAEIVGATGIEIRAGTLVMDGGSITANAQFNEWDSGNGNTVDGVGIAVSQHTYNPKIDITISNGTISGFYAFYQANHRPDDAQDMPELITVNIEGGTFNSTNNGTLVSTKTPAAIFSEALTGFISGATFNTDVDSYAANSHIAEETNGTWSVIEGYWVTFDIGNTEITVGIPLDNTVADYIPEDAKSYVWMYDDDLWNVNTVITGDITLVAFIQFDATVGTISEDDETYLTVTLDPVFTDPEFEWKLPDGSTSTENRVSAKPGDYTVTVTVTDDNGVTGTATAGISYRPTAVTENPDQEPPRYDITHSGQILQNVEVSGEVVTVVSSGVHSDIDMSFSFNSTLMTYTPTIEVSGNVGADMVTISIDNLSDADDAVIDTIMEAIEVSGDEHLSRSDVVSVDVTLDNITNLHQMIIKIPMGTEGHYVASGQAFYIEDGNYVPVVSRIVGEEVWIYTDHNTPYVYVATSYAAYPITEDDPTEVPVPEPDPDPSPGPSWNPGWDDDDYVPLPPQIANEDDSGNDEAVMVAACAAAAVVAAILVALIIMEYRRK